MRIILSSAGFLPDTFGGGQVYVYNLARELLSKGHNVEVVTNGSLRTNGERYSIEHYFYENIPVTSFSLNQEVLSYGNLQKQYGTPWFEVITEVIKNNNPDILHINGIKPAFVSVCNKLHIPHVVTVHHTGIICPAGALVRTDGSICNRQVNIKDCVPCCNVWRRPKWYTGGLLGEIPGFIYRPIGKRLNDSKKLSYIERGLIYSYLVEQSIEVKKMLLKQAQRFIAPSFAMQELLIRNGCNPEKISLIPHGIEPFKKLPIEPLSGRPIRFGYVGRIDRLKGLHILLKALEILRNGESCELHIFGGTRNPWDEEYFENALSKYHGKSKIVTHGLINPNKMTDIYGMLDVLVVPSLLPEAFGLVVSEAFSTGRPVIVFNSGGLAEQVTDGVNGFVIKSFNKYSLAEVIQKVVNRPNIIAEMSSKVPNVKTIAEQADEIETTYRGLLKQLVP